MVSKAHLVKNTFRGPVQNIVVAAKTIHGNSSEVCAHNTLVYIRQTLLLQLHDIITDYLVTFYRRQHNKGN